MHRKSGDVYTFLGSFYGKLGEFQKEIDDCDMAIRIEPNWAKPYSNGELPLPIWEKFEEAIDDQSKAILSSIANASKLTIGGAKTTKR